MYEISNANKPKAAVMKKPTYKQIIDWNERRGDQPRFGLELLNQLHRLQSDFAERGQEDAILCEFIPLRLATILEVFLREAIRELVDSGEPYLDRAENLTKGTKIDLAFAVFVDQQRLSIGDFAAHAVSVSNVRNFVAALTQLEPEFVAKLKVAHPRWTEDRANWPLPPLIADYQQNMRNLQRMIDVRNVLAHELPTERVWDFSEIPSFFAATQQFIEACDWVIVELLQDSTPRTQTQMNDDAGLELKELEEQLSSALKRLSEIEGICLEKIKSSQDVWLEYANKEAELVASNVEGGSMYSMVWSGAKSALVSDRLEQVESVIREWMN